MCPVVLDNSVRTVRRLIAAVVVRRERGREREWEREEAWKPICASGRQTAKCAHCKKKKTKTQGSFQ